MLIQTLHLYCRDLDAVSTSSAKTCRNNSVFHIHQKSSTKNVEIAFHLTRHCIVGLHISYLQIKLRISYRRIKSCICAQ